MNTISRQNLFGLIKKYNLQNEVKNQYGKPYTNVPNYELENIINEYERKHTVNTQKKEVSYAVMDVITSNNENKDNTTDKVDKLISLLSKKHILLNSEIQEIYNK